MFGPNLPFGLMTSTDPYRPFGPACRPGSAVADSDVEAAAAGRAGGNTDLPVLRLARHERRSRARLRLARRARRKAA